MHAVDMAVKAISPDGWRIGGYLVVFGNAQQTDLQGEWFTRSSDLGLDWYDRRPLLFEHSRDPKVGAALIGTVDRLDADDLGVWVEGQLDRRSRYAAQVRDLVAKGALGWSSGSMSHLVRKRGREIMRWPICEASVTVTPAEPRTLALPIKTHLCDPDIVIDAFKSLGLPLDRLEINQETGMDELQDIKQEITQDLRHEIKSLFAQATADQKPRRTLPIEAPASAKSDGSRVQVVGDVRYAELSAEDMAFLVSVYASVAAASRSKASLSPIEQTARDFFYRAAGDPNRSLQREISAKAIREHSRHQLPDSVIPYLPYKSLDAVFANDYDETSVKAAIKANELDNTGQAGFGLEWVPTIWNVNLWRRVRISNPFASNVQMIDMPSNPFNIPIESTDPAVYYIAEGTDSSQLVLGTGNTIPLSKVGSDKRTLTAKKLGTRIGFSTELVEDSIIPVLPYYRHQAQRVLQNYVDDTVVNGDTASGASTNVNFIDGTPTTGTSYLAMDGMRKYCLVTNTTQMLDNGGGTPTLAQFRNLRKTLNKHYAADLLNLVYVVSWEVYMRMLSLPEFSNWGQLGVPGSNVTGLLPLGSPDTVADTARPVGVIDGIPVYVSAQIGLAQATGKISGTPANNTLGTVILFHRTRWFLGYRRHIDLQMLPLGVFSDTYQLWATVRFGLQSFDMQSAAVLINVAV